MEKHVKNTPIKSSTKDRGALDGLGTWLVEGYLKPKANEFMHDATSSFLSMVSDSFQAALDKIFYPEGNAPTKKSSGSTSYETYYRKGSSSSSQIQTYSRKNDAIGTRSSREVKMIWVDTEEDAKDLVNFMLSNIANYGSVRVGDLYESLTPKVQTTMTDWSYGWNKTNADISYKKEFSGEHRGQYFIDLPAPVSLD